MLDSIALSDLDAVDRWTKGPVGPLVQVMRHDKPPIGWPCAFPRHIDCLLIVDGEFFGKSLQTLGCAAPRSPCLGRLCPPFVPVLHIATELTGRVHSCRTPCCVLKT